YYRSTTCIRIYECHDGRKCETQNANIRVPTKRRNSDDSNNQNAHAENCYALGSCHWFWYFRNEFFRLNSFCDGNRSLLIPFPFKGMLWKSFLRFERRTRCGFFRKTGFMLQELESPEHKKSNKNEDDICHKGNEEKQNRA